MQNFRALEAPPPDPHASGGWGLCPQTPQPPAAGGFAPRSPLAFGGWGLRPQTPKTAPPHCEFLATRLAPVAALRISMDRFLASSHLEPISGRVNAASATEAVDSVKFPVG